MKPLLLLLLAAGFAFPAGEPAGFHLWKAGELKAFPSTLASRLNGSLMTSQPLANLGNYNFSAVLRKESGAAELHEIRGTSISGGVTQKVAPGDVLTIPANMPHQMKVDAGKQIAYLAIKVAHE